MAPQSSHLTIQPSLIRGAYIMQRLFPTALLIALLAGRACQADTFSRVTVDPISNSIRSGFDGNQTGWISSQQNPNRLDHTTVNLGPFGHASDRTLIVRRADGSLSGYKWNMHIGPAGSYFGSGRIDNANSVQFQNRFNERGGHLTASATPHTAAPVQITVFQRQYVAPTSIR